MERPDTKLHCFLSTNYNFIQYKMTQINKSFEYAKDLTECCIFNQLLGPSSTRKLSNYFCGCFQPSKLVYHVFFVIFVWKQEKTSEKTIFKLLLESRPTTKKLFLLAFMKDFSGVFYLLGKVYIAKLDHFYTIRYIVLWLKRDRLIGPI